MIGGLKIAPCHLCLLAVTGGLHGHLIGLGKHTLSDTRPHNSTQSFRYAIAQHDCSRLQTSPLPLTIVMSEDGQALRTKGTHSIASTPFVFTSSSHDILRNNKYVGFLSWTTIPQGKVYNGRTWKRSTVWNWDLVLDRYICWIGGAPRTKAFLLVAESVLKSLVHEASPTAPLPMFDSRHQQATTAIDQRILGSIHWFVTKWFQGEKFLFETLEVGHCKNT